MVLKKLFIAPYQSERYFMPEEEWEYLEEPNYQTSCGSKVCITCRKFTYSSNALCGSILCCKLHKKLIYHGEHLTHACELYEKNTNISLMNESPEFSKRA